MALTVAATAKLWAAAEKLTGEVGQTLSKIRRQAFGLVNQMLLGIPGGGRMNESENSTLGKNGDAADHAAPGSDGLEAEFTQSDLTGQVKSNQAEEATVAGNLAANDDRNTFVLARITHEEGAANRDERNSIEILNGLVSYEEFMETPQLLEQIDPDEMFYFLQRRGEIVEPLGQGNFKGIPYEKGGGYRIHWGGDRILSYHPASRSHHGGAYFKVSSGKLGTMRIILQGDEE